MAKFSDNFTFYKYTFEIKSHFSPSLFLLFNPWIYADHNTDLKQ